MTVFAMVCRFPSWSVFSSLEAGGLCPNSAKAGFGGFGLGLLVRQGFRCQSVFAVVREGVADKPGKILCSFFLFCSGGLGLAWEPGGAGILFFLPGLYGKAAFWGKIREASFCLSFCSPSLFFVFVFSMYLMFFFCYNFGVRGFLWTRFLSC